eukprot:SAG22_NODE_1179_length_5239_cov_1.898249_2_plen_119_part_00
MLIEYLTSFAASIFVSDFFILELSCSGRGELLELFLVVERAEAELVSRPCGCSFSSSDGKSLAVFSIASISVIFELIFLLCVLLTAHREGLVAAGDAPRSVPRVRGAARPLCLNLGTV